MDGPQNKPETNLDLKIASLNIENIKANSHYLQLLASDCNIVCIQEHWLHLFEDNMFNEILPSFSHTAKFHDSDNLITPSHRPRGTAGVAILWNQCLDHAITPLPDGGPRICMIEIKTAHSPIILVNVYMPTQGSHDRSTDFNTVLDEIFEITEKYRNTSTIIWTGDFNSSLCRSKPSPNDKKQSAYCNKHGFAPSQHTPKTATYHHFAYGVSSQIDYFMQLKNQIPIIESITVDPRNPTNTSSHDPIFAKLSEQPITPGNRKHNKRPVVTAKPNWNKIDRQLYADRTDSLLSCLSQTLDSIHPHVLIDRLNAILANAAKAAGAHSRSVKKRLTKRPWTKEIKPLVHRSKQLHWVATQNPTRDNQKKLKDAKRELRSAQRQIAAEERRKTHAEIMKANEWDHHLFYKLVSYQRKSRNSTISVNFQDTSLDQIDGWEKYFSNLAKPLEMDHFNQNYKDSVQLRRLLLEDLNIPNEDPVTTNPTDVAKTVSSLKNGKAADIYGLTAEHLKYASPKVIPVLTSV